MKKFWFEFNLKIDDPHPPGTLMGCGITAHNLEDAKIILNEVFKGYPAPIILTIKEDVDLRSLDERHVLPNIGPVIYRGVWFPRL